MTPREIESIEKKYNDILQKISKTLCRGNKALWYYVEGDYIFYEYYDSYGNDHQDKYSIYKFLEFFNEKPKKEEKSGDGMSDFYYERDERDDIGM